MSERPLFDPEIPDEVREEALIVPAGETKYWFLLDDATVELLAQGICPRELSARAHGSLDWKREFYRVEAREKASA